MMVFDTRLSGKWSYDSNPMKCGVLTINVAILCRRRGECCVRTAECREFTLFSPGAADEERIERHIMSSGPNAYTLMRRKRSTHLRASTVTGSGCPPPKGIKIESA